MPMLSLVYLLISDYVNSLFCNYVLLPTPPEARHCVRSLD